MTIELPDRPRSGPLPHLGVLRLSGADTIAFLQGQLSNDASRLAAAEPLLAALSTPQGRVVAVMHLLAHSSGVLAILPAELVQPTADRLRRYVLRSKVKIEDLRGRFGIVGCHAAVAPPAGHPAYWESDGLGTARVSRFSDRTWRVGDVHALAALPGGDLPHGERRDDGPPAMASRIEQDWRLADIRDGLPQVYEATSEAFVAQMLNLDLLDGISFTKGCYTGQEIIARTQHLGRIKRRMVRLRLAEGSWRIGQAIELADGRSGRLTELARDGARIEALAVLTTAASEPQGAPVDAVELPLPYAVPGV